MKAQKFSQLIDLYLKGSLPQEVNKIVDQWDAHLGKEELPDDRTEEEKADFKRRTLEKSYGHAARVIRMTVYRVAASFLLVAVTSYVIWNVWFREAALQMVTSPLGKTTKVMLDDGSIVWLKSESSLSYAENFKEKRHVTLEGEALFEVASDPSRPFTIDCRDVTAQVLGTSFNIKTKKDNNIEVLVLTGRVKVSSPDNQQEMAVLPNEKAIYYDKEDLLVKETVKEAEASTAVAGTEYIMQFDDESALNIFDRIEKKFNVSITMDKGALANCTFRGDFTDHSLEQSLALMAEVLGFEYTITERHVTVKGGAPCK